jgi:aspartyl-tRNA(Asn)/glutamyl-tRNA(Gln) amidotransferase subunit C
VTRVTTDTVAYVAALARLSLSEEERVLFARQLDEILGYAESIQALDTSEVDPMSHAGTASVFREAGPHESLPRERVLAAAPDPSDGLFRVPKVIG